MWPKKRRNPLSFSPELYFKTQRAAEHQKKKEKKRGEYNNNKLEINFETRGGREEEAFKILCRTENSNTKEGKNIKKFTPTKAVLGCTDTQFSRNFTYRLTKSGVGEKTYSAHKYLAQL